MKKIFLSVLIILLSSFVSADFTLSPEEKNFGTVSGGELNGSIHVTNTGSTPLAIQMPASFDVVSGSNTVTLALDTAPPILNLEPGAEGDFLYSFLIDALSTGSYSGTFELEDNESITHSFDVLFNIDNTPRISMSPSSIDFNDVFYGRTATKSFTIKNEGGITLTTLKISSSAPSSYDVKFDPDSIATLPPGETKTISISSTVPFGAEEESTSLGLIQLSTTQAPFSLANITIRPKNYLKINKIRSTINGETQSISSSGATIDEKVQPEDTVRLEVEVENLYNEVSEEIDIASVEAKITIQDLDEEEDLELESTDIELTYDGSGRKHTFPFDIIIPEAADEGSYDVEIEVTGEDDDGHRLRTIWTAKLSVEKKVHELILEDLTLAPASLSCDQDARISFTIQNLGRSDEDCVRYTIKNADLGISVEKSAQQIDSGTDDNTLSASELISFDGAKAGTYELEVRVYREYDLIEDVSAAAVTITRCGSAAVVTPPPPSTPPPSEPKPIQPKPVPLPKPQEPPREIKVIEEPIALILPKVFIPNSPAVVGIPYFDKKSSSGLSISLLLAMNAFVFLLIILFVLLARKH